MVLEHIGKVELNCKAAILRIKLLKNRVGAVKNPEFSLEPLKEEPFKEEPFKEEPFKEEPFKEDLN